MLIPRILLRIVRPSCLLLAVGFTAASCTENAPPPAKSELKGSVLLPEGLGAVGSTGGDATVLRSSSSGVISGPLNPIQPMPPIAPQQTSQTNPSISARPKPAPNPAPKPPEESIVVPPGAHWTILCAEIGGPGHGERAKRLKDDLAATTHLTKWYVVHEDDKSLIYYGFYKSIERGTSEGQAAHADRAALQNSQTASGAAPLRLASFKPIDRAAPDAPAEWDLARQKRAKEDDAHFWSLQIAAYTAEATDDQGHDRKWAAVESVKALRGQGIPAYYYHGDAISSVCIGVWPANAVKQQQGGNLKGNAAAANANEPFFVTNQPLPQGMVPLGPNGKPIRALAPRVEIIDPSMYEMIKRFPSHQTNSEEIMRKVKNSSSGQMEMVPEPSLLVLVPEPKDQSLDLIQQQLLTDQNSLPLMPPSALKTDQLPTQPGLHKLRSVGE